MTTTDTTAKLPSIKQMFSRSLSDHQRALTNASVYGFVNRPGFGGCSRHILSTLYRWQVIEYTGDRTRALRLTDRGEQLLALYVEQDEFLLRKVAR